MLCHRADSIWLYTLIARARDSEPLESSPELLTRSSAAAGEITILDTIRHDETFDWLECEYSRNSFFFFGKIAFRACRKMRGETFFTSNGKTLDAPRSKVYACLTSIISIIAMTITIVVSFATRCFYSILKTFFFLQNNIYTYTCNRSNSACS